MFISIGAGSARLTNEDCSPFTVHYAYDTVALAKVAGSALVKAGNKSWFFLTADYAFGHSLQADATTVVKAIAVDKDRTSPVISAHFTQIDPDRTIKVESKWSSQYAAAGEVALIDGIRGAQDWRTGAWQGYVGTDVLATVELGSSNWASPSHCTPSTVRPGAKYSHSPGDSASPATWALPRSTRAARSFLNSSRWPIPGIAPERTGGVGN